jgi:hypothetical protein
LRGPYPMSNDVRMGGRWGVVSKVTPLVPSLFQTLVSDLDFMRNDVRGVWLRVGSACTHLAAGKRPERKKRAGRV